MTEEKLEIEKLEFIHEIVDEPPVNKKDTVDVLDILHLELQDHMKNALNYKRKIEEAKTLPKKDYYKKKLKKNNEQAQKILIAIDRVSKQKNIDVVI